MRSALVAVVLLTACAGAQRPAAPEPDVGRPPPLALVATSPGPVSQEELARAVARAPRRAPNDRIEIVVFDVGLPKPLRSALEARQVQHQLATELRAEPLFRVAATDACNRGAKTAPRLADCVAAARQRGLRPDVWVLPTVVLESPVGDPDARIALLAEVASAWETGDANVDARGAAADSAAVVKQAALRVRDAIVGFAAGLPSRPAVAKLEAEREKAAADDLAGKAGVDPDDDAMTRLRKLYEAQQSAGGASR